MVDVKRKIDDYGWLSYSVSSEKSAVTYHINKANNGYSQYTITPSKGRIADELSGMYTTPDIALEHLLKFIDKMNWTQGAKNRETAARVAERKKCRKASAKQ